MQNKHTKGKYTNKLYLNHGREYCNIDSVSHFDVVEMVKYKRVLALEGDINLSVDLTAWVDSHVKGVYAAGINSTFNAKTEVFLALIGGRLDFIRRFFAQYLTACIYQDSPFRDQLYIPMHVLINDISAYHKLD